MTTAFVLSGGASLGAIEVGMLQTLIGRGIRPDLVVGTSVGALNGAWLAAGSSESDLRELADLWRGLKRSSVFPTGLFTGFVGFVGIDNHLVSNRGIRRILEKHLRFGRMEDAPIPLHVIAADVLTGKDVRLSSGPAVDAVLASAAIPGILPPVVVEGRALVDGGVVNNTPISHAIELGATTVWVLPTGYACTLSEVPRSALGMALLGVTLAINQRLALDIERYEGAADIKVVPPLCPLDTSPADFGDADELIRRAREQTAQWLDEAPVEVGQADLLLPHMHR
ncbi:patatin-like phospholipase family protein [Rhodococcus oxybenzonivorans]|uniref:patatin-like phospholipase family protein n=1 Tax=Rhodococcus TaxID=1827 RepID=UPI0013205429|nr:MULTISPECIES: patatin-like phospholipase family protein [Rhodococcus]MDV7353240.1 patatin-like phospholipase family protein [Rhodococcus oxybenzonivorans]QHE68307.1 Patatin [Rhodococcus sp. WAY2]